MIENKEVNIISSKSSLYDLNLREVWNYKDLLFLLVKRDFITFYKQTILGPLWFLIQPILSTLMFYFIFVKTANISTDGIPGFLFILSGQVIWSYFSDTLIKTSNVFVSNANIFGKVYFPRLVMPLSIVCSGLIRFSVQLIIFIIVWIYYLLIGNVEVNIWVLAFPYLFFFNGYIFIRLRIDFFIFNYKV